MTRRRRDRRPAPHPDQPSRSDRPVSHSRASPSNCCLCLSPILLLLFVLYASFTAYRILYAPPTAASPALSVYDRGLVKPNIKYQEIVHENERISEGNRTHRHFPNPVLAYITPWNSKGYEMAKLFCSKFSHLSPVWYDLKSEGKKLVLDGRHNADMGWISELRKEGSTRVLPRVVLEAFPADLLQKKQQRRKAIDIIVTECNV